jgi:ArsR family transcriptional regulator
MAKKASVGGKAELTEWARGFALLSDPTRLGILKMLAAGPKNVTSLCDALGLKQPTISHHLGLLRMGRLVVGTRQGKSVVYVADPANMKDLAAGLVKLTPSK